MTTSPRHDLYAPVHAGLRALLRELVAITAHAPDAPEHLLPAIRDRVRRATAFLREHAEHEDDHVGPLIAAAAPALARSLDGDHACLHRGLDQLDARAERLVVAPRAARASIAGSLHAELCAMVDDQDRHMRREETEVCRALWAVYDDATLEAAGAAIQADIPLPRMVEWLEILLPAWSADAVAGMLAGIRAGAPAFVSDAIFTEARRILGARWTDLPAELTAA